MRVAEFVAFDSKRFLIRFPKPCASKGQIIAVHNDIFFGENTLFFWSAGKRMWKFWNGFSCARKNFAKRKQAHKLFDDVQLKWFSANKENEYWTKTKRNSARCFAEAAITTQTALDCYYDKSEGESCMCDCICSYLSNAMQIQNICSLTAEHCWIAQCWKEHHVWLLAATSLSLECKMHPNGFHIKMIFSSTWRAAPR